MILPRKEFYFIRHGRTHANQLELMCGGAWDVPLLPLGEEQARTAAQIFARLDRPPEVLWVSPMLRARQTADIINAELCREIFHHEGLREWLIGDWEELPWSSVPNPFVEAVDPPNGEMKSVFQSRVLMAISEVLLSVDALPLFVAHGAVAHVLFEALGYPSALIENCAPYRLSPLEDDLSWKVEKLL